MVWGAIDCLVGWFRSVKELFPLLVSCDFLVDCLKGVIEGVLGLRFQEGR